MLINPNEQISRILKSPKARRKLKNMASLKTLIICINRSGLKPTNVSPNGWPIRRTDDLNSLLELKHVTEI